MKKNATVNCEKDCCEKGWYFLKVHCASERYVLVLIEREPVSCCDSESCGLVNYNSALSETDCCKKDSLYLELSGKAMHRLANCNSVQCEPVRALKEKESFPVKCIQEFLMNENLQEMNNSRSL